MEENRDKADDPKLTDDKPTIVVGIGASAGGLEALEQVFEGMPAETGIDLVLPPQDIGKPLHRYAKSPNRSSLVVESRPVETNEPGLKRLIRLLRDEYGIDFSVYKQTTVLRRIERRLLMSETEDFEIYVKRVAENPDELHALYRDLLIGVTQFFRDSEAFELLSCF